MNMSQPAPLSPSQASTDTVQSGDVSLPSTTQPVPNQLQPGQMSPTLGDTSVISTPVGTPPASPVPTSPDAQDSSQEIPTSPSSNSSELLEDQNIFVMLGVQDGEEKDKEAFLDELQQVIWEDFLEYDVKLLVTAQEQTQLEGLMGGVYATELEKQEKIVIFLEKLIPDLEDIMLEKALELKADMFFERIAGLREYFSGNDEVLAKIDAAETLAKEDKWASASNALNGLPVGT